MNRMWSAEQSIRELRDSLAFTLCLARSRKHNQTKKFGRPSKKGKKRR